MESLSSKLAKVSDLLENPDLTTTDDETLKLLYEETKDKLNRGAEVTG